MPTSGPSRSVEAVEETRRSRRSNAAAVSATAEAPFAPFEAARAGAPPLSHRQVATLQRVAGNHATTRAIGRQVQRHAEGTELPKKEEQVAEIQEQQQALPEATRTKSDEKAQVGDAAKSGKAFQKAQKLTPGAMSLASAQKILQGAFGGLQVIVPGTIVILADQPACVAKYDEVCMADNLTKADGTPWTAGHKAELDLAGGVLTQGFAWKGIVYVNGQTTLVTATAHEILHNNVAAGFRAKVGETFNEGITELLARRALSVAGVSVPSVTAYPDQVKFTVRLQKLVGDPTITESYFGGADTLVNKFEELKGVGTWATLRTHAEALDEGSYNAMLAAKKGK